MIEGEYGMGGVEPHPLRAAITTFLSLLLARMIPLLPFLLNLEEALTFSAWMTLATFFCIGAVKSFWSLSPWWRSAGETLLIGGAAAVLAFGVGTFSIHELGPKCQFVGRGFVRKADAVQSAVKVCFERWGPLVAVIHALKRSVGVS